MKITLFLLIAFYVNAAAQIARTRYPAQITFRLIDDSQNPIKGEQIGMSTFRHWVAGEGFGRDVNETVSGTTNSLGIVTLSMESVTGQFGYSTSQSPKLYRDNGNQYKFANIKDGKWHPWNPIIEVLVKPIKNPIAMYANSVETMIPTSHMSYGYDLMIGDWVAPLGKGKTPDLVFRLDGKWKSFNDNDSTLTVSFINKGDGIIQFATDPPFLGSELRSPRFAPKQNYRNKLVLKKIRRPDQNISLWVDDTKEDQNYFIRVRTQVDAEGKIVSANYGKIYGGFKFAGASVNGSFLKISTYYLNPNSNDLNMEFDTKHNLFGDLPSTLQVTNP